MIPTHSLQTRQAQTAKVTSTQRRCEILAGLPTIKPVCLIDAQFLRRASGREPWRRWRRETDKANTHNSTTASMGRSILRESFRVCAHLMTHLHCPSAAKQKTTDDPSAAKQNSDSVFTHTQHSSPAPRAPRNATQHTRTRTEAMP